MIPGKQRIPGRWIALAGVLILAGCAGSGPGQFAPSQEDLARFERITTVEAVSEIEQSFQASQKKQLDFYAPEHFELAGEALASAKAHLSDNTSRDTVIRKVATAEAVLRNGDRVMARIKDMMQPELTVKQRLDELGADTLYRPEYETVLQRLKQVIRDIETGKGEQTVTARTSLMQEMRSLQTRSLRYNALNETEELLKRVKHRGADKLAPVSYAEALQTFELADKTIKAGLTDPDQIAQLAEGALFAARRVLYVTQAVAALTQMVTISPEQVILDEEYRLYRIARMLGVKDLRDNSLEVQSEQLAKASAELFEESQQQLKVANILREAIVNQASAEGDLTRLTQTVDKLKQEQGEWLAKQALFQAKVAGLEAELAQYQTQLAASQTENVGLNAQLAEQALKLAATPKADSEPLEALPHAVEEPESAEMLAESAAVESQPVVVSAAESEEALSLMVNETTQAVVVSATSESQPTMSAEPAESGSLLISSEPSQLVEAGSEPPGAARVEEPVQQAAVIAEPEAIETPVAVSQESKIAEAKLEAETAEETERGIEFAQQPPVTAVEPRPQLAKQAPAILAQPETQPAALEPTQSEFAQAAEQQDEIDLFDDEGGVAFEAFVDSGE